MDNILINSKSYKIGDSLENMMFVDNDIIINIKLMVGLTINITSIDVNKTTKKYIKDIYIYDELKKQKESTNILTNENTFLYIRLDKNNLFNVLNGTITINYKIFHNDINNKIKKEILIKTNI